MINSQIILRRTFIILLSFAACCSLAPAQILDWSANGTGTPSGGTGDWNTTSKLWAPDGTSTYQAWPNTTDIAQFGGTAGTVTLTTGITASDLTFTSDGYIIGGSSTLNLINDSSNNNPVITVANAGQTATIDAPITVTSSEEANLTLAGPGTIVLGGSSSALGFVYMQDGVTVKLMAATGSMNSGDTLDFGYYIGAPIQGGTFIYDNTGATAASSMTIAGPNPLSGESTIETNRVAAQNITLNLAQIQNARAATLNFVTNGGTGTQNEILVTGGITGYQYEGDFFNGSNYAVIDPTTHLVRGINYGVDAHSELISTATTSIASSSSENVEITAPISAQATATLLTLEINGADNLTLAAGKTLTVNGLLKAGGNASVISGGTSLKAGSNNQIIVRTDQSTDSLSISTPIVNGSSASAVVKSGAGTLTLTGANTYTGATDVLAGTLLVNNTTGNGTGTGVVTVLSGATLGGKGSIKGATEIEAGAMLQPSAAGNSAGHLTFSGGLQFDANSTLSLSLGTTQDEILATSGSLDIAGKLTLNLFSGTGYNSNQAYTLVNWTGTTSSTVSLSDFVLGSTPAGSAGDLSIVGNTLVLDATAPTAPEPSTWALLLAGVVTLAWLRRKRCFA